MTRHTRACLAGGLAALSERERLLLALSRIDGLAPAEMARVLGGSPAAAARDLQLAERRLQHLVDAATASTRPAASPRTALTRAPRTREEKTRWRA